MNTHTRSMIQPRPNLRRVPPLDEFEQAMRDVPIPLPPPDDIFWRAWLRVPLCAVGWTVAWWVWPYSGWNFLIVNGALGLTYVVALFFYDWRAQRAFWLNMQGKAGRKS
jgi:hypothetical protein